MSTRLAHLVLPCLIPLTGCAALGTVNSVPSAASLSGNWQIQSGTSITSAPAGQIFLVGSMQTQDSQVTATFNTVAVCPVRPIINYTGTYNATTGALTLNVTPAVPLLATVNVQLTIPSNPSAVATGTTSSIGALCNLTSGTLPAVGIEVPPLTGTYTGTVAAANATTTPATAVATLTLTQSATANASAQFPVTGTLQFTASTSACSSTTPVTGTISGTTFTLTSAANSVTISGFDASAGNGLSAVDITFAAGPCTGSTTAATYAGTLQ